MEIDFGQWHLGDYRWTIHIVPYAMERHLRDVIAAAGERVAGFFDVHYDGERITWVRAPCADGDAERRFFLEVNPREGRDIVPDGPARHMADGCFGFWDWGYKAGGACVMARPLPDYPIHSVRTGQCDAASRGVLWETVLGPEFLDRAAEPRPVALNP